jgi:hypothetical protein
MQFYFCRLMSATKDISGPFLPSETIQCMSCRIHSLYNSGRFAVFVIDQSTSAVFFQFFTIFHKAFLKDVLSDDRRKKQTITQSANTVENPFDQQLLFCNKLARQQ